MGKHMSRTVCVESPHHISSIWVPYIRESSEKSGSRGLGLIVSPRTKTCYFKERVPSYFLDLSRQDFTKDYVSSDSNIGTLTGLPPGYGYSVSAATLIGLFIVKEIVNGPGDITKALIKAHRAEIEKSSGLGDVLAISNGKGIVYRVKEGAPSSGVIYNYSVPSSVSVISVHMKAIHTSELLGMYSQKTRRLALKLLKKFEENPSFETFISVSQEFTLKARMHVFNDDFIEKVRNLPGLIGFYAKKSVFIIFCEADHLNDMFSFLKKKSWFTPILLEPDYNGINIDMWG